MERKLKLADGREAVVKDPEPLRMPCPFCDGDIVAYELNAEVCHSLPTCSRFDDAPSATAFMEMVIAAEIPKRVLDHIGYEPTTGKPS